MSIALTTLREKSLSQKSDTDLENAPAETNHEATRHGNLSALEIQILEKKNRLLDIQIKEKEDQARIKNKTRKERFCETW